MKLLDLTDAYQATVVSTGSWRSYEKLYPALFRHYFRFWAKRSYPNISLDAGAIQSRTRLIRRKLPGICRRFAHQGFDVDSLDFVLFVGKNCTNGHAFNDDGRWVVWLPVESYESELLVSVFVTHEIAHAFHYLNSPRFYFSSAGEQRCLARQLLTEGIASYATAKILRCSSGVALWADFLSEEGLRSWMSACETKRSELNKFALKHFGASSRAAFFQANEPDDIFQFRAGYYLGLSLIDQIASDMKLSLQQVLALPRRKLETLAEGLLSGSSDRPKR